MGRTGKGCVPFICKIRIIYSFLRFKKSLSHTQVFYSIFECPKTSHFEGVLAIYIEFSEFLLKSL